MKYTIDGLKFDKAPDSELNLNVNVGVKNEKTIAVKEQLNLESENEVYMMEFAHSGKLNGDLEITVYPNNYSKGTVLKLYYFDEQNRKAIDMNQTIVVAADGSVTFMVNHFSSYFLVENEENTAQPSQSEAETTTQQAQENSDENNSEAPTEGGETVASPSTGYASSLPACTFVFSVVVLIVGVYLGKNKKITDKK